MGAFFLIKKTHNTDYSDKRSVMEASFAAQGFVEPQVVETQQYTLFVYQKLCTDNCNLMQMSNDDFVMCTGTFLYDGQTGKPALESFLSAFTPESSGPGDLRGDFCLVVRKAGRTYLFVDDMGVYKVYKTDDGCAWTSSFLAAVDACDRVSVDKQAAYEFVFQGASFGGDTVVAEIKQLAGRTLYDPTGVNNDIERTWQVPPVVDASFDTCVEECLTRLRDYFKTIAECFGDRIDTALSGGYDSRLTLALLLERHVLPEVHVYGAHSDSDVQVAKAIDSNENLNLEHIDKGSYPKVPVDEYEEIVKSNYQVFDGIPIDGVFRDASDHQSRIERTKNGKLLLNGGGGEIFRNFYYLFDRPFEIGQFLSVFYCQFDPACGGQGFDETEYLARLGHKIRKVVGNQDDRLSRTQVEFLYPGFRCRFWMGRNNSVNNRFGYTLTPFIDPDIVTIALSVPIKYKNYGKLEAELINRVNPKFASYASGYGHTFDKSPPLRRVLKDLSTYIRPPWVRKYSFRIKNRRSLIQRPYHLADAYVERILPDGLDYAQRLFKPDFVKDAGQLNRLLTLEYFLQRANANW